MDHQLSIAHQGIRIKWPKDKNLIKITLNFSCLENKDQSVVYSTKSIPGNINGFIHLKGTYYFKLLILNEWYHELVGRESKYVKIGTNIKEECVKWTVYLDKKMFNKPNTNEQRVFQVTTELRSPFLYDLYSRIIISPHRSFIEKNNHPSAEVRTRNLESREISKLIAKDLAEADKFNYQQGPNADGNRKKYEYFAGTGSNMGRGR